MAFRSMSWMMMAVALLGACADDPEKPGAQDAGKDSGSNGGRAGDSGARDSGMALPVSCAGSVCVPPEITLKEGFKFMGTPVTPALAASFGYGPFACCTAQDKCGVTNANLIPDGTCEEQHQAGRTTKSDECPSQETSFGTLVGCCRTDGKCGVNADLLGVGCLSAAESNRISAMGGLSASASAAMVDASFPMLVEKSCNYASPDDTDAGDDAGR
jgi:hypothetical protein